MIGTNNDESMFRTFEVAKLTQKFVCAVLNHIKEGKNCNHTLQEVLANMLVEKVREYLIGEDLAAAQDKELEKSIRRHTTPDPEYDKGSLSIEEAEAKAREGQDPGYMLFKKAMEIRKFWDTIQKHLDEGNGDREGGGKCKHRLSEILYDIPTLQKKMKEI